MIKAYNIKPTSEPRQSRRDKFNPTLAVQRYRAFRDECRLKGVSVSDTYYHVIFFIKVSGSWSNKKKKDHFFTPHKFKPDKDNLEKALLDAVFPEDDSHIFDGRVSKFWAPENMIVVSETDIFPSGAGGLSRRIELDEIFTSNAFGELSGAWNQ
jgi:Holliday junction resolvase RusA-like endonuclease